MGVFGFIQQVSAFKVLFDKGIGIHMLCKKGGTKEWKADVFQQVGQILFSVFGVV